MHRHLLRFLLRFLRLNVNAVILFSLYLGIFSSSEASELGDQLSQAFKARISYLDRELTTFRYEPKTNFEPKVHSDLKGRLKAETRRFANKSLGPEGMAAGPGTYAAIDPYVSRVFGGNDPQLYVLPLKKGTAILDLVPFFSPTEKALIKNAHEQLKCKKKDYQLGEILIPELEMNFFSLRNSITEACRILAIEVVTNLQAQAIMYSYAASNGIADCRDRSSAFNIVNSSAIAFENSALYTNNILLENTPLSSFVKSIYEEAANDFQTRLDSPGAGQSMPLKLQGVTAADEPSYADWKAKNILNCGPKWSVESDLLSNPYWDAMKTNFNAIYKDLEVQDLIIKFKETYNKKANFQPWFQLTNFNKIAKMLFLASGLPDDEEIFKKWLDLQSRQYGDPAAKTEFLKLYGADINPIPNPVDVNALIKSMTVDEIKSIDFLPRIFDSYGFKGGYQVYNINQTNIYQGGLLTISSDSNLGQQERLSHSKSVYMEVLKSCIDIYANDQISFEDTKKTECGLLPTP